MANPYSILIIDDSPDDILLAKRAISKSRSDCSVEIATDGKQAMERLGNGNPPTLILLDLKMPGIDGIKVLLFIRTCEQTRYIPVIMLTSSNMVGDIKASFDAGANSFVHKAPDFFSFTENLKTSLHYWIDINLSPI